MKEIHITSCDECGWIWTPKRLIKGYEKDDMGEFFRCKVEKWGSCGKGFIPDYEVCFKTLKQGYIKALHEKEAKKHKYTMEEFVKQ